MHPAYSVIFFTTASGMGYGLLILLGMLAQAEMLPANRLLGLVSLGIALIAVTFGLLSSMRHLGHPERVLHAYTQWRSSWLSREGVLATMTYVPAGLFAAGWVGFGDVGGIWRFCGFAAAVLAGFTVYSTGMIYATLRPIHAWCNRWVVPTYLSLAVFTGALWLNAILLLFGHATAVAPLVVLLTLLAALYIKWRYWRFIGSTRAASTPETATGLGSIGNVRLLDPPPTQTTYVTREMGYRIARKHAATLRRHGYLLLFALPFVLTVAAVTTVSWMAACAAAAAALSGSVGVVVERWLFFAEAKHVVTLYHGAKAA
ncbi:MAG: dimethyl sulfoxide reductase anchor subunit [Rhodospirillales bacterium]|nr:dimethyl sulfoxide reductase anchor subunit [Rhodospirillales bacterium]